MTGRVTGNRNAEGILAMNISLPGFGKATVIGLDIGSHAVKAVEIVRKSRDKGFDLRSLGQASLQPEAIVQGAFLNSSAIVEGIQRLDIDRQIARAETDIVEAPLGNTADERHLAALESNANGTAGTCGLAFTAATGGFAPTAGFTLTKPLAPMLRAGTRFKIV